MTHRIIAIDCGTTATKAWVVADGRVIHGERALGGVRDVVRSDGRDRRWLRDHIRTLAEQALSGPGLTWADIDSVVAFGMVTSEFGLVEVPHLESPIGREQLASGLRDGDDETLPVTVRYVPGVIYGGDGHTASTDFMRGEETEIVGLLTLDEVDLPLLYVSPGSHTKFVRVGPERRIGWSFTTLSGELLWALSQETILAGLVDPSGDEVVAEAVDRGAVAATEYGLTRALYRARLLNRVEGASAAFCSSFVMGAVVACDIAAVRAARRRGVDLPDAVHIADGPPMSLVYEQLLDEEPWVSEVRCVREPLGALGAWALFESWRVQRAGDRSETVSGQGSTSGGNR